MKTKRLIFCTNSSLYSSYILEGILSSEAFRRGDIELVGVFLSKRIRTKTGGFVDDIMRVIKASGIKYALYLAAYSLFFELCRFSNFRPTASALCQKHGIDLYKSKDINAEASLSWLKSKMPDVLLSGFFNQKLSEETLSIPDLAAVNLHPALLPLYKGVDPVFFYFLNSEPTLGVSLHQMDITYDTGEILRSSEMGIQQSRSVSWHNLELFKLGTTLFLEWLNETEATLNLSLIHI